MAVTRWQPEVNTGTATRTDCTMSYCHCRQHSIPLLVSIVFDHRILALGFYLATIGFYPRVCVGLCVFTALPNTTLHACIHVFILIISYLYLLTICLYMFGYNNHNNIVY